MTVQGCRISPAGCVGERRILESAVRDTVIVKVPGIRKRCSSGGHIGELHRKRGVPDVTLVVNIAIGETGAATVMT